jgi:hypothetical protein
MQLRALAMALLISAAGCSSSASPSSASPSSASPSSTSPTSGSPSSDTRQAANTRWAGTMNIQQWPGSSVSEACFGPVLLIDSPGANSLGCIGLPVLGYEWAEEKTLDERRLGRMAVEFVEGTLSTDRTTFTVKRVLHPETNAAVYDQYQARTVLRPAEVICDSPALSLEMLQALPERHPELRRMPVGLIPDMSGGEDSAHYEFTAAFVVPETFRVLCEAGAGLDGISIIDPMHPIG